MKIRRSKDKLWGFFWGNALFFQGGGIWSVRRGVSETDSEFIFFGWLGITFGTLGLLIAMNGLLSRKPFAVEFSPTGFVDHRYFRREIPWEAVLELGTFEHRGSASVTLGLEKGTLSKSELRIKGRIQYFLNRRRGSDVFYMPMFDLDIPFQGLLRTIEAFLRQYQPNAVIQIPQKYKAG